MLLKVADRLSLLRHCLRFCCES